MAEDYFNAFDYYDADPPREGSVPPPDEAAAAAPEDEYNEKVHESVSTGRPAGTVRSVALALFHGLFRRDPALCRFCSRGKHRS